MCSVCWCPGVYSYFSSWGIKINSSFVTLGMLMTIFRHLFLMSTPAQFCWLQDLGHTSFRRPSVNELVARPRIFPNLGFLFSYVDSLYTQIKHKFGPFIFGMRSRNFSTKVFC